MPPVLQFEATTKLYRRPRSRRGPGARGNPIRALDSLSFTVERGEIFGFLGANGAGKTTAIHIAMGFVAPSEGSGTLLGYPFGRTETKRQVGFVPENVPLHFWPAGRLVGFMGR
jgi:ABC-2 type transport system ATP-binding protein